MDDCGCVYKFVFRYFYSVRYIYMLFVCLEDRMTRHLAKTFSFFFDSLLRCSRKTVFVIIINSKRSTTNDDVDEKTAFKLYFYHLCQCCLLI